jgi:hypothetical protein
MPKSVQVRLQDFGGGLRFLSVNCITEFEQVAQAAPNGAPLFAVVAANAARMARMEMPSSVQAREARAKRSMGRSTCRVQEARPSRDRPDPHRGHYSIRQHDPGIRLTAELLSR